MISDRNHHVAGSISGPGDALVSLKNAPVSHLNGGIAGGSSGGSASVHQATLMTGMNLLNQGFHQQQGNHLNNINALQQQHNSMNHLHHMQQLQQQHQQQQGHAILGSGVSSGVIGGQQHQQQQQTGSGNSNNQQQQQQNNYDYAVRLAAEANCKATMEKDYYKAIILYGDAISLHNRDCRFFLNRSYCYAQLELYQLALDDAEDAIKLDPKSGKCFYRKGQALIGLKKYMDAEKAFLEVLRLEPDCPETSKQLIEVRLLSLQSLGFDPEKSKIAATKYNSIEEAISALLALRMDDSFADQQHRQLSPLSQKWPASSMWDHHPDSHAALKVQVQSQQTAGWAPMTGGQSHSKALEGNLIGSGLRNSNTAGVGVIGSGQSQHQQHLINGYTGSDFSTNGLEGSTDSGPAGCNTSSSSTGTTNAAPVINGFSSAVGSNGFYSQRSAIERANSSSPLDKRTDSLSINHQQQHLSHQQQHHHQMVIGNNTMNANNSSQQSRLLSGGVLMNHPNDQMSSVFDGACISKSSVVSYSSAVHASATNLPPNLVTHVVVSGSPQVADYPKNNAANTFNSIISTFSNASITNHQHRVQHPNQSSVVIGSGRHASGGSSAGHTATSGITISSYGLTSGAGAAAGLSIGNGVAGGGGGGSGESEPSISPVVSTSDSDSSLTINERSETAGASADHHLNQQHLNHLRAIAGGVNFKHQQLQHQQIGSKLMNGSGVASVAAAPVAAVPIANNAGSVWGSAGGEGGSGNGGTFADIVKKKTAPATGSKNGSNNNNKKSESTVNGRNHHNQPKDQMIGSLESSDMNTHNTQIKDSLTKTSGSMNNNSSLMISKRPTNIWCYNGLRVANVSPSCPRSTLTSIFSKFGKLKLVERITNKNVENQIWVFYDNPTSPVEVIAKYQGIVVPGISLSNSTSLKFYFAATDDQKDLKFSRPKQPQDSRGECYYWRTTNCFSRESCSLLHIPSCKNIDAQVWMKMNREPNNTSSTNSTN